MHISIFCLVDATASVYHVAPINSPVSASNRCRLQKIASSFKQLFSPSLSFLINPPYSSFCQSFVCVNIVLHQLLPSLFREPSHAFTQKVVGEASACLIKEQGWEIISALTSFFFSTPVLREKALCRRDCHFFHRFWIPSGMKSLFTLYTKD